jgi:hypothetical protein
VPPCVCACLWFNQDLLEFVFGKDASALDLSVEEIMQPTYFIPETMTIWTCFQARNNDLTVFSRTQKVMN